MKASRVFSFVGRLLAVLTLIGCLILVVLARSSGHLPGHITDVSRYSEVRKGFEGSILVQHFPEEIPDDAVNVHFDYLPRLMQGGMHFQLRLELPRERVEDLRIEFLALAEHQFQGGGRFDHERLPNGVPTTCFYTGDTEGCSFPSSYEVFVLDAQPGGGSEAEWNHGHSYGIAVDVQASEIVYWAEYW